MARRKLLGNTTLKYSLVGKTISKVEEGDSGRLLKLSLQDGSSVTITYENADPGDPPPLEYWYRNEA